MATEATSKPSLGFNISRPLHQFVLALYLLVIAGATDPVFADDSVEYNRDVRPILAEYCFACHGADSASRKADLRLDDREAAISAGAIVESEPDDSELLARINSDDPDLVMPPPETKKVLTSEQKTTLTAWIAQGAEYQPHWSYLAPHKQTLPPVHNWVKNEIDRFVFAKLSEHGLTPAPAADARTLFRRLHLDITGLPPDPSDVAEFVEDYQSRGDRGLSEWIDRLMETTAWGEHRARYWLDAARYGDTHGMHFDNYREMWPYRDWVIRAFNANKTYDDFTLEQLAGDLLPNPTNDQLIATGFQRCNITTNEGGTIDEENLAVYASDRVQTFGWVYLGLTVNCCQCHDHKFDPLTMKDYYALAAFFRNTTQPAKDGNTKDGRSSVLAVPSMQDQPRWHMLPEEISAAKAARQQYRQASRPDFEAWLKNVTPESLDTDVLDQELIIQLKLNEGHGNDVLGVGTSKRTYAATGDITWIPGGKLGFAPAINNKTTFNLGDVADFEKDQSFSFGAWVKTRDQSTSGGIIARMDASDAAYRGWDLWQNAATFAVHMIDQWPSKAIKVSTQDPLVAPKKWQHVFVTYDGSGKAAGIKIFVDGKSQKLRVEYDALGENASIKAKSPLWIGQRSEGQYFEGGAVQDVRLYERQLGDAEIASIAKVVPIQTILATPAEDRTTEQNAAIFEYYLQTQDDQYAKLSQEVTDLESEQEAIRRRSPITHIQEEKKNSTAMAHILMRGEYDKPTKRVTAATPAALHPYPEGLASDRLGLAKWVIDPSNPLTARVTVNRFWQEVFGQGIVPTPEDFGVMGMLPSNQELLDWLSVDFVNSGWDVKRFFKQIFMSAAYRQSAVTNAIKLEKDRGNRLLSRGPRFRMDAEMIRDYALASAGLLSTTMYGPGVKPYQPDNIWDMVGLPEGNTRTYVPDQGENLYRRTLYTFWKRMAPPPNLEAFNAPSREVCVVRRERTNTPLQALVTLNDPQFVEAARKLAERSFDSFEDNEDILRAIALRLLSRPLTDRESEIALTSQKDLLSYYASHTGDAKALLSVGEAPFSRKTDLAELAAWTMVCNQMMNLDEVVNK